MAPIQRRHCNSDKRTDDDMRPGLKLEDSKWRIMWDHFWSILPVYFSICQMFFMTMGMWRLHTEGHFEGGIDWQAHQRLFEENSLAKCLMILIPPSLLFLVFYIWNRSGRDE